VSHEPIDEASGALYDPIEPAIDERLVLRSIFARAYVEPKELKRRKSEGPYRELPSLDGMVLSFDCETVEHGMTFGALEIYKRRRLKTRAVFYRDDLPATNPKGYDRLKAICRELDVRLVKREWLFQHAIWPARKYGWTIAGFNVAYDLSRVADCFEPATITARLGALYCNGFALKKGLVGTKKDVPPPVFCRIKRDDRHHVRFDMKGAAVLDLSAAAFAYTDRNHSLASACRAFGIPFERRPGEHSGEITSENVAGCLCDVAKTSELLWAIDAEHSRHPIGLYLSRAQSGASIAKAYLDALGVRPRLEIQPDLKAYLGYAAQAYFGGRVEARIVKTPLPCVYLDFLSMYPTVFALLGLWHKHVTPARLEVEEIAPEEIVALLDRLREHSDDLFDPLTWDVLDFFALVEPSGANLPARATIPPFNLSRHERIASEASYRYEETLAAQAPFWSALDEYGGKIVPDMVFDARRKRWKAAGEFDDIPRGLLRRNPRRPASGRAFGNIDEITRSIRDAIGAPELTTSDVLDFFASHRRPTIADARREVRGEIPPGDEQRATNAVVTIGPTENVIGPLWYAGPDLAAAAIADGEPRILRAWRLRPHGTQETQQRLALRGADPFDPEREDLFARFVELRRRTSSDALDDERRSTGYKVIANSGAYGVFAETTPIDIDPADDNRKPRRVTVYADTTFETAVDRPERHGRFNFFPTASLVTAGARLMLALAQREVQRLCGEVAYCDTDGLAVVATKDGGFVLCEGGPYRLADGTRAVHALSWAQVDALRDRFVALNPYDREAVPGSILKLEDENFADERREQRCDLYAYAVSEKLYALFTLDARGEPVIRKYSSHVLGQYRSPIPADRHGWIIDAWKREIRSALARPVEPFAWEQYPAISQLTLTTWSVFKPYRENNRLRPFDFLAVGVLNRSAIDLAIEEVERLERCCEEPRPACSLFADLALWREQDWRCLRCGEPWDFERRPRLKTYGSLIRSTLQGAERKRLAADGTVPTRQTRGLLIPRLVRVEHLTPMGKEVIVDPTDTNEGLTAEMLGATEVLEYENLSERVDALRAKIRAFGDNKQLAKESGLSDRALRAIVNQGALPRKSTIEKLEAALKAAARS
jgi:hypothetical protein